ncbi:MAG: c-type cytochrome [Planctomycetes bacterium]|nr:c-type cytochrome [Planctomycetota bacterium]
MHVIFAASSVAMLAVTVWMLADDHSQEWHDHQRTFEQIEALRLRAKIGAIKTGKFTRELAALEKEIADAQAQLDANAAEYEKKKEAVDEADLKFVLKEAALKTQRAERDVARANRNIAIRDKKSTETIAKLRTIYEQEQQKVDAMTVEVEQLQKSKKAAVTASRQITRRLDIAKEKYKEKSKEVVQLNKSLLKLDPDDWRNSLKRKMMELPIVQGFNQSRKPKMDWIADLPIKMGMTTASRYDHCRTCHLGMDKTDQDKRGRKIPMFPHGEPAGNTPVDWVAENKYPHPYSTHANFELFVTPGSPHPVSKFGCTICHDGDGSGVKFQHAEHSPNHPQQGVAWKKKWGYHSNHFWEYPMQPSRFIESSCIKCHHQMEELGAHPKFKASAPKVTRGYRLMQKFGCFGCHEIRGFEGDNSIGPDIRLEPPWSEAAKQLRSDRVFRNEGTEKNRSGASGISFDAVHQLAAEIVRHPDESIAARRALRTLLLQDVLHKKAAAGKISGSDPVAQLRRLDLQYLSRESQSLVDLFKDVARPGKYRKVGPSLRHIAEKTTQNFVRVWVRDPRAFRKTTKMPQFFDLTNQQDGHAQNLTPIEIAAVAQYLFDKSQPLDAAPLDPPRDLSKPANAKRGKKAFAELGCVACHLREDVKGSFANFGPDLTRISEKIKRDKNDPNFSTWLYTWIRDPQRYHSRTKMPNLFLGPKYNIVKGKKVFDSDPAADITAYLLDGKQTYTTETKPKIDSDRLQELMQLYLSSKDLTTAQFDNFMTSRIYPKKDLRRVKGDEIELALGTRDGKPSDSQWQRVQLAYIGRRTISRYGCYACHDIPGFEKARPIGTTLQDWGRKDTTKLDLVHIEEYLQHHGEADGSSTLKRAEAAYKRAVANDFPTDTVKQRRHKERELAATFFYRSLLHHGRAGFFWQKLRAPRSYDYEVTQTKRYDERLRMPRFTFMQDSKENEAAIEDIATFVLGLVADPPPPKFQYTPKGAAVDRDEGERLLRKYNCTGCHMLELPKVTYWASHETFPFYIGESPEERAGRRKPDVLGVNLLRELMPTRLVLTGMTQSVKTVKKSLISFRGLPFHDASENDDEDNEAATYLLWELLRIEGLEFQPGANRIGVPVKDLVSFEPGRGGQFTEWLYRRLKQEFKRDEQSPEASKTFLIRNKLPPVLWREGYKVQTPWLYQFLRNPHVIRPMAILRMPRFNLSRQDAKTLANYFAAVDGVPYPYQRVAQRTPAYAQQQNRELNFPKPGQQHSDYLSQSWKLLTNKKLCLACHNVAGIGRQKLATEKEDIRGPDLRYAADRLRPRWARLWIADPRWITPHTKMPPPFSLDSPKFPPSAAAGSIRWLPVAFSLDSPKFPESFDGNAEIQLRAVRDALMNYPRLLEKHKNTKFEYPTESGKRNQQRRKPPRQAPADVIREAVAAAGRNSGDHQSVENKSQ